MTGWQHPMVPGILHVGCWEVLDPLIEIYQWSLSAPVVYNTSFKTGVSTGRCLVVGTDRNTSSWWTNGCLHSQFIYMISHMSHLNHVIRHMIPIDAWHICMRVLIHHIHALSSFFSYVWPIIFIIFPLIA